MGLTSGHDKFELDEGEFCEESEAADWLESSNVKPGDCRLIGRK
jgi:hypothetical protein